MKSVLNKYSDVIYLWISLDEKTLKANWLVITLSLLSICCAACSYGTDSGLLDQVDGDIDRDDESAIESDDEREADQDDERKGDLDQEFEIIPKPDGDPEPDIDPVIDGDSEIEGGEDRELDRDSENETDGDLDFRKEDEGWPVTLRGELRTGSENIERLSYFELYRGSATSMGHIPSSVHDVNPAPYRIPGGLAYPFVFHQHRGALFWIRGAVDLNGDGVFIGDDLQTEFGYTVGQPFDIPTGGAKKDIRIYLDYHDPTMGSVSGKIITKPGYLYHPYQIMIFDKAIALSAPFPPSFTPVEMEPPELESGTIAYHFPNLPEGNYHIYSNIRSCWDGETSKLLWIAHIGNPIHIELADIKDLTNINLDYRELNLRCDEGACQGDEGNELAVGKICTSGGGECPQPTVCGLDLEGFWPGICLIMNCQSHADCGSKARCQPTSADSKVCLPNGCYEVDPCIGEDWGNSIGVGEACTPGGEECDYFSICLSDFYPGEPSFCTYFNCNNNSMCGNGAYCFNHPEYSACYPNRCDPPLPDLPDPA